MAFHGRRQSRDRAVCARILEDAAGRRLWMSRDTLRLFEAPYPEYLTAAEDFLAQAGPGSSALWRSRPCCPGWTGWRGWCSTAGTGATPPTPGWMCGPALRDGLWPAGRSFPATPTSALQRRSTPDETRLSAPAAPGPAAGRLPGEAAPAVSYDLDQVPAYAGEPYVVINDNQPFFGEEEYTTEAFETYSALDGLGRCGTAYACVGEELMPAGERESISSVKPSGWINVEYGGQYLYNRCHLIGFQLTGENANERNLITGTRYMNVEGMLPFENLVADYVKETSNHVLYRVTPLYEGTIWWPAEC